MDDEAADAQKEIRDAVYDMEKYLFQIEHENIYARFYKMGDLFEEIPDSE